MFTMRTLASLAFTAALVAAAVSTTGADHKAFLGRWNLSGTGTDSTAVYWLELKEENGQLSGMLRQLTELIGRKSTAKISFSFGSRISRVVSE